MVAEMLALSEKGDNATVDMLVGDIYGQDYSRLGLKSTMSVRARARCAAHRR